MQETFWPLNGLYRCLNVQRLAKVTTEGFVDPFLYLAHASPSQVLLPCSNQTFTLGLFRVEVLVVVGGFIITFGNMSQHGKITPL